MIPNRMRLNENFRKYFPDVEAPEERENSGRSSALKAGTYMVINQVVKDRGLDEKLKGTHILDRNGSGEKNPFLFLVYSVHSDSATTE